jgi:hypothetical protein
MSTRVEMLKRIDSTKPNPFLCCNILSLRTLQLATRYPAKVIPDVINMALAEFLEGKLNHDVIQVKTNPAPDPVEVRSMPKGKKE